ncbi:MAG: site-specific DNA-methyltransferase [Candidatus Lokiarchaeota archaeon]|nr:site-specific DNA-methyltransferase [Candidatus Lokiarchaeota archaeon]
MKTKHSFFFKSSKNMNEIGSETIDLIVTSPPYPMIEMWDEIFSSQDLRIQTAFKNENGKKAFNLIHQYLTQVWNECIRVCKEGGIICINIGDATRKIGKTFQLYPNHVKITEFFLANGCICLPIVLWRKATNSPTKFMGSGMLAPNAYVTLEHEYILIIRKGNRKRNFEPNSEKRYQSAFFWEERNKWFSDIWTDITGISQEIKHSHLISLRERSAAFPFELAYRLINMFSIYGDTILDPFWGTGTTSLAAMILARNSLGYEINPEFKRIFNQRIENLKEMSNELLTDRIDKHIQFVSQYSETKDIKYKSVNYQFPVVTKQEKHILFYKINEIKHLTNSYEISYNKFKSR